MHILLTRPDSEAFLTQQKLEKLGHTISHLPLMEIVPLPISTWSQGPFSSIILTSPHAWTSLSAKKKKDLLVYPFYCVGARLAYLLRDLHPPPQVHPFPDLQALLAHLPPSSSLPFLYLSGLHHKEALEERFHRENRAYAKIITYEARQRVISSQTLEKALFSPPIEGIFYYSRRSAELLLSCIISHSALSSLSHLAHFCLSHDISTVLKPFNFPQIIVAETPSEEALFQSLHHYSSPYSL